MSGCDVTGEKSHTRGFPLVKLWYKLKKLTVNYADEEKSGSR
jgi:hypothetical protein